MNKRRRPYSVGPFDALCQEQGTSISNNWQPSVEVLQRLRSMGASRQQLQHDLRAQFIIDIQNKDIRKGDWNKLFEQFAIEQIGLPKTQNINQTTQSQQHYQESFAPGSTTNPQQATLRRTQEMTDDWRPSDEMVRLIAATICSNEDYLNAQLISFTSHFHGQFNPNWDQQFKKWINNGWNVYGHKKNFTKNISKDDRDFVEKHTDKSWRDGL